MNKSHEFEDSYAEDNSQVEDDTQDQRGAKQILQIDEAADCAGSLLSLDLTCMKCMNSFLRQKSFSCRASP